MKIRCSNFHAQNVLFPNLHSVYFFFSIWEMKYFSILRTLTSDLGQKKKDGSFIELATVFAQK